MGVLRYMGKADPELTKQLEILTAKIYPKRKESQIYRAAEIHLQLGAAPHQMQSQPQRQGRQVGEDESHQYRGQSEDRASKR